ncbi:MAG: carbonic anhydrase [Candidatus Nanopelagicales bacterium]
MPLSRTAERHPFPADEFRDVLAANAAYADAFQASELGGRAARGLAVVTCIDSRIDPLGLLGMSAGDVKIVRNAGARVTDDVLRTLALATFLLGVRRILILPHTDCKMASAPEAEIHATIRERYGVETRSIEFRTVDDQESALVTDVVRVRSFPLLAPDVTVAGAVYDVRTGRLNPVDV